MRSFVLALTAVSLSIPATMAFPTSQAEARSKYREWRGKDGRTYCKKSNGTTGLIVGGVGGALLGRTIDTRGDRTVGTLGGAALGALAGREIDRTNSNNKRRCR